MSSLVKRILTILIGAPVVIGLLWIGKQDDLVFIIVALVSLVSFGAARELSSIAQKHNLDVNSFLFSILCSLIPLAIILLKISEIWLGFTALLVFTISIGLLREGKAHKLIESQMTSIAWMFGIGYCAVFPTFFWLIYQPQPGLYLFIWLLTLVWAFDIGAFLSGKLIGRTKLAPKISPNKTWEGVFGGLTLAVLSGLGISFWISANLDAEIALYHSIILSILIGIVSQLGDLVVSKLKRMADVKDSGTLLPGHGGLLDRIDGLLFAAPVFYFYLIFFIL